MKRTKKPLGKLTRVDLRKEWKSEAQDFTPWLGTEENIKLLGDTIGLDLEVQTQEQNVGPFRADILCLDTVTDNYVLVENQLERTDHTHLGQLMTYAAGLDAVSIVWISPKFTEEHRAALDWLNNKTDDSLNFFGVEVELFQIGDSAMAPNFKLVSKPNDWSKSIRKSASASKMTDTKQLQLEFWQALREYLEINKASVRSIKPLPQSWTTFAIGRSYFHMTALVNTRDNFIGVYLVMSGPESKAHYHKLADNYQSESYAVLGKDLEWRELPDKTESHVRILRHNEDMMNRENWGNQHKWIQEQLEGFNKFFKNKIKAL